jgi:hypothetical protein
MVFFYRAHDFIFVVKSDHNHRQNAEHHCDYQAYAVSCSVVSVSVSGRVVEEEPQEPRRTADRRSMDMPKRPMDLRITNNTSN